MDYNRYYTTLDTLVLLNREYRDSRMHLANAYSLEAWAQEHCTISCDIGRRTGKTGYINRRAESGDLIITSNLETKNRLFYWATAKVLTFTELLDLWNNQREILKFSTIFVDEPKGLFSILSLGNFYSLLTHSRNQTFILLGPQVPTFGGDILEGEDEIEERRR